MFGTLVSLSLSLGLFRSAGALRAGSHKALLFGELRRHVRFGAAGGGKMVPPVEVSPLIKFTRYSALLLGMIYGKKRYDYLQPIAAEEKRIEEEEKKRRDECAKMAKALAEASEDTILK